MTFTRALAGVAVILGLAAPFAGDPYSPARGRIDVAGLASIVAHEEDHVPAPELAKWIRDRKPGLRIVDVRPPEDFAAYQIPTAENVPIDRLDRMSFSPSETIVLYSDGGAHAAQAWVFLRALGHQQVFFLRGGLNEWLDDVMSPTKNSDLTQYFGGVARRDDERARDSGESATQRAIRLKRRGC